MEGVDVEKVRWREGRAGAGTFSLPLPQAQKGDQDLHKTQHCSNTPQCRKNGREDRRPGDYEGPEEGVDEAGFLVSLILLSL